MQNLDAQSDSSFTKILTKRRQQKGSSKKVQNDKIQKSAISSETIPITNKIQKEPSKITNSSLKLFDSDSEESNEHNSDTERSSEQEFSKDELEGEDEDIVMQDIKSSSASEEEEDEEEEEEDENNEEEWEENSNEDDKESNEDTDEEMEEKYDEIVEDATKISLNKKQKEKEQKTSQDETTSNVTAEVKFNNSYTLKLMYLSKF
jgi:hypothetical protein